MSGMERGGDGVAIVVTNGSAAPAAQRQRGAGLGGDVARRLDQQRLAAGLLEMQIGLLAQALASITGAPGDCSPAAPAAGVPAARRRRRPAGCSARPSAATVMVSPVSSVTRTISASPATTLAGKKFICGEPMKPATNRLLGRWYSSSGEPNWAMLPWRCTSAPARSSTIWSASVIASTWSCVT